MMIPRWLLKTSILVLVSAVSFAAASESGYVDENEGCFKSKSYPCALKVLKSSLAIEKGEQRFVLEANSVLLFKSESEVQLISGEMWIEKSSDLVVKVNPYLDVKVSGEFWIAKANEKTSISNLNGEIQLVSSKILKGETVPVGFQNWYAGIRADQKMDVGIIQPIAFEDFASKWAQSYSGPKAEKILKLKQFREQWKNSLEAGSEFYSKIVQRSVAAIENKQSREIILERTREQERADLLLLYRQKNYLDPDSGK